MSISKKLVAYYKLDEASGAADDAIGSADLTDNNTVGATTGKVNGARNYVRANSETHSSAAAVFDLTGTFTIVAWIRLTTKTNFMNILSKWLNAGNQRSFLFTYDPTPDRFIWNVSNDGTAVVNVTATSFGSPSTATFYFVVLKHVAGSVISIQVNNGTVNTTAHTTGVFDSTANFRLGGNDNLLNFFDGDIDEVGVWTRSLSADELTYLYNAGTGRTAPFTVTEVESIVDPAGGGDYTTLSAAEAGEQRNLVQVQESHLFTCRKGNLGGGTTFAGWTVEPDLNIKVRAHPADRHKGRFTKEGVAYIDTGVAGQLSLGINHDKTEVEGLVFDGNNGSFDHVSFAGAAVSGLLDSCIFGGNKQNHVLFGASSSGHVVRNSIFQDVADGDDALQNDSGGPVDVRNCAFHCLGGANALVSTGASTIREQNNYFKVVTGGVYTGAGNYSKGANSATSNAEAVTAGLRNVAFSTTNFAKVTGSYDFRLQAGSVLVDGGQDLSAQGFTDDIVDRERPDGAAWDIGPHESQLFVNRLFICV